MWNLIIDMDNKTVIQLQKLFDNNIYIDTPYSVFYFNTKYQALAKIAELEAFNPFLSTYNLSKLTIRRRLRALNLENTFNTILDSNIQMKNDWNDAQYISIDDPVLLQAIPILQENLNLSDDDIDNILLPE